MKISPQAKQQLSQLLASQPNTYMRVEVKAGGCSGFERVFALSSSESDDTVLDDLVVVDPVSLELLTNALLHWSSSIGGNSFSLEIPDSQSTCGCGKSFSI